MHFAGSVSALSRSVYAAKWMMASGFSAVTHSRTAALSVTSKSAISTPRAFTCFSRSARITSRPSIPSAPVTNTFIMSTLSPFLSIFLPDIQADYTIFSAFAQLVRGIFH